MAKKKFSRSSLKNLGNALVAQGMLEPQALDSGHIRATQDALEASLDLYTNAVAKGYRKTLEMVTANSGPDFAEQFKLKHLDLGGAEQQAKMQKATEEERLMQVCMDYSDEMLKTVFDLAIQLKEQKQWDDAVLVLTFLLYLCPAQAWFWYELASCWHTNEQWDAAMYAYAMAIDRAPKEIEFYRSACNCLLDARETEKAKELLNYGLEQFKSDRSVAAQENVLNLESALVYVNSQ